MTTRAEELRQLMADNNLSVADVAELLTRKPMTVRIWRCATGKRAIPQHSLDLLKLKLAPHQ